MIEKYISALEEIQTPNISNGYDLQTWKAKAINIITRIYGEGSKQEEQVNLIKFQTYMSGSIGGSSFGGGNNSEHCRKQSVEIIKSFISDLNTFGLPEKTKSSNNNGINISVNQNQTVSVNVIWESIKDELTGKQLKEIEEIINDKNIKGSKKEKIVEKLKSFGTDIASNIIASLLTNPTIYGG